MKKFFKFAAVAAIAAMFVSCTEKPGPDPEKPNNQEPETPKVEITENIAFTLEVTEVEIDKAKVKVEHNGTTKDTWYAFATTEADVNKAVAAKVTEPVSGRTMEVYTTEPGVQVYTSNWHSGFAGAHGATFPKRSAICFEAQHFPDSPNRAHFPSVVLCPGETYKQVTVYKFGVEK